MLAAGLVQDVGALVLLPHSRNSQIHRYTLKGHFFCQMDLLLYSWSYIYTQVLRIRPFSGAKEALGHFKKPVLR